MMQGNGLLAKCDLLKRQQSLVQERLAAGLKRDDMLPREIAELQSLIKSIPVVPKI